MMIVPRLLYVDPSIITYAIQAVAGVAIAIGAVAIIMWRKAKKKVSEKLNLEDKSIKETEEAVQIIDDSED